MLIITSRLQHAHVADHTEYPNVQRFQLREPGGFVAPRPWHGALLRNEPILPRKALPIVRLERCSCARPALPWRVCHPANDTDLDTTTRVVPRSDTSA